MDRANRRVTPSVCALMVAAALAAACDRPRVTNTAYNNSGNSAAPGSVVPLPDETPGPPPPKLNVAQAPEAESAAPAPPAQNGTAPPSAESAAVPPPVTTSTATSDTASPSAPTAAALGERTSESGVVADTVTTGKVRAAIAADPGMKESDVSVSTTDGVVTLEGSVSSQEQIAIATNLAQRQEGVSRVEANLSVR